MSESSEKRKKQQVVKDPIRETREAPAPSSFFSFSCSCTTTQPQERKASNENFLAEEAEKGKQRRSPSHQNTSSSSSSSGGSNSNGGTSRGDDEESSSVQTLLLGYIAAPFTFIANSFVPRNDDIVFDERREYDKKKTRNRSNSRDIKSNDREDVLIVGRRLSIHSSESGTISVTSEALCSPHSSFPTSNASATSATTTTSPSPSPQSFPGKDEQESRFTSDIELKSALDSNSSSSDSNNNNNNNNNSVSSSIAVRHNQNSPSPPPPSDHIPEDHIPWRDPNQKEERRNSATSFVVGVKKQNA